MPFLCSSRRLQLISVVAISIAIVIVLVILFLSSWPSFARDQIVDHVLFKNGTPAMDRFTTTADLKNLQLSINVFRVKNAEEVLKSQAPIELEEIGPFVYHEYKYKEILDNNQDTGLITYKLRRRYTFKPELSVGDPKKINITWINVPVLSAIPLIEKKDFLHIARGYINACIYSSNDTAFITDTVENLVFSGSFRKTFECLQKGAHGLVKPWPLPDNKFAVFYRKNDSWIGGVDYNYTSSAGFGLNQTYRDLNQYKLMNGSSVLPFWRPEGTCNQLGGTDGQFFSPLVNKSESLQVYSSDICRKLSLQYRREVIVQGIKVYEYTLDHRDLQSPKDNPGNRCYCLEEDDSKCSIDGLIDLSKCVGAGEVFASGAHFLYGAPELTRRIHGLQAANATNDEPIIHIEPNTGLSAQVKVPIQINVRLTKFDHYPIIEFFKETNPLIIPLLTVTESAELDSDQATQLRSTLLILDSYFILMILGGAIILVIVISTVTVILCTRYRNFRQQAAAGPMAPTERDPLLNVSDRS